MLTIVGITDEITSCDCCGRPDLKKTIVIEDENGKYYATFSKLEYAEEEAQDIANGANKDIFIEKITTETIKCVISED